MKQFSETTNTFLSIFLRFKILTYNNFLSIPKRKKECRISDLKEFVEHSRMHFLYFCRNCRGISKYFLLKFPPNAKIIFGECKEWEIIQLNYLAFGESDYFAGKTESLEARNQRNCLNRWRYKRSLRFRRKNTKILQLPFCFTLFIKFF